jgi:putative ABC transport system ATP-binding protein
MNDQILVDVRRVTKTYEQDAIPVHALHEVDIAIGAGEFTALAGPSGSGKTTLLNLIGALDTPSNGDILVGGASLREMRSKELASLRLHKIGFVFQDHNLLPVLSALENVEYVLVLQKVAPEVRRQRAEDSLRAVGLGDFMHRRPNQLSGGQQQRVAIARAIVGEPLLVLADEPSANLDSETGAALLDMMLELNHTRGTTFLFSTHDSMVMDRARRIVRLKDGKITEDQIESSFGCEPAPTRVPRSLIK